MTTNLKQSLKRSLFSVQGGVLAELLQAKEVNLGKFCAEEGFSHEEVAEVLGGNLVPTQKMLDGLLARAEVPTAYFIQACRNKISESNSPDALFAALSTSERDYIVGLMRMLVDGSRIAVRP